MPLLKTQGLLTTKLTDTAKMKAKPETTADTPGLVQRMVRLPERPMFTVRVTRTEFFKLPMSARRRILSEQTDELLSRQRRRRRTERLIDGIIERNEIIDKLRAKQPNDQSSHTAG